MKKKIGIYKMGHERVQLYVTNTWDGSFWMLPDNSNLPEICVGIEDRDWWKCLRMLYHEVFEFAMTRRQCRYDPSQSMGESMAEFLFVMSHTVFSDVCGLAADFISRCEDDLFKAWKQHTK